MGDDLTRVESVKEGRIGEYLGRIFIEVKNRNLYFVEEYYRNIEKY